MLRPPSHEFPSLTSGCGTVSTCRRFVWRPICPVHQVNLHAHAPFPLRFLKTHFVRLYIISLYWKTRARAVDKSLIHFYCTHSLWRAPPLPRLGNSGLRDRREQPGSPPSRPSDPATGLISSDGLYHKCRKRESQNLRRPPSNTEHSNRTWRSQQPAKSSTQAHLSILTQTRGQCRASMQRQFSL